MKKNVSLLFFISPVFRTLVLGGVITGILLASVVSPAEAKIGSDSLWPSMLVLVLAGVSTVVYDSYRPYSEVGHLYPAYMLDYFPVDAFGRHIDLNKSLKENALPDEYYLKPARMVKATGKNLYSNDVSSVHRFKQSVPEQMKGNSRKEIGRHLEDFLLSITGHCLYVSRIPGLNESDRQKCNQLMLGESRKAKANNYLSGSIFGKVTSSDDWLSLVGRRDNYYPILKVKGGRVTAIRKWHLRYGPDLSDPNSIILYSVSAEE